MLLMKHRIIPEKDLRNELLSVEKPARYLGGEYGVYPYSKDFHISVVVSYPDLYEIGMSNKAVRILYNLINSMDDVFCDIVFPPAPDFEDILKTKKIPLYGLQSGMALNQFDIIAFSLGYELTVTNMCTVLERGGIPLKRKERGESCPIVILGGPAVTNPEPLEFLADCIMIGEGEGKIESILERIKILKGKGATREEILFDLGNYDFLWVAGIRESAKRAFLEDFGYTGNILPFLPVPNVRIVQDHGVVEIMRGCPNGCRFCQAGYFYRPFREKAVTQISKEVDHLVRDCGYREITLSSLSTGDYSKLDALLKVLIMRYQDERISFSLPSLRINTFTLSILKSVSKVRKSGLTFAVETATPEMQACINKNITRDFLVTILQEAKAYGWKYAKLYFMIGLPRLNEGISPLERGLEEGKEIQELLWDITKKTGFKFNVTIGTFIPKPHTPFQWIPQLSIKEAETILKEIKKDLPRSVQLHYHSPTLSFLEGMIARGDRKVGNVIEKAYSKGARLDAWEEHFRWSPWREAIEEEYPDIQDLVCGAKDVHSKNPLPWDSVSLGVGKDFLREEYEKGKRRELTEVCHDGCSHPCGVCKGEEKDQIIGYPKVDVADTEPGTAKSCEKEYCKILFRFSKKNRAAFLSHLDIMNVFERSMQRAGIPVDFTEGFNPKPRLQFVQPLFLGFSSSTEYGAVILRKKTSPEEFIEKVTPKLPQDIDCTYASDITEEKNKKRYSLMSVYWGATYVLQSEHEDDLHKLLKNYRKSKGLTSFEYNVINADSGRVELTINDARGGSLGLKKILSTCFQKEFWKVLPMVRGMRTTIYGYDRVNEKVGELSEILKQLS